MEFSRPEYWRGVAFPSPGDLTNPGIKPRSPALQVDSLPAEPPEKPKDIGVGSLSLLQWIFPIQELKWGLLHCRWILYLLSYYYGYWSSKIVVVVAHSLNCVCPTLWDPMDYSPLGYSVHKISQARILEWIDISFSRGSSQTRDWTRIFCIASCLLHCQWFFTTEPPEKPMIF